MIEDLLRKSLQIVPQALILLRFSLKWIYAAPEVFPPSTESTLIPSVAPPAALIYRRDERNAEISGHVL